MLYPPEIVFHIFIISEQGYQFKSEKIPLKTKFHNLLTQFEKKREVASLTYSVNDLIKEDKEFKERCREKLSEMFDKSL